MRDSFKGSRRWPGIELAFDACRYTYSGGAEARKMWMIDSINAKIEAFDDSKRVLAHRSDAARKAVAAIEAVGDSHRGRAAWEIMQELRRRVPDGTLSTQDIRDVARNIARF
jgi:hypothetical protein